MWAGCVQKIRHSSHIDPIPAKLSTMVLLCLRTLIEVEILKSAHRLGLGDQKREKMGPKPDFFQYFRCFFKVFLHKNGHNWATNGPIATFYGCNPFSFPWAVQKNTETWCRINLCGENACQTQMKEEKIHRDFILFTTVFLRKEALSDGKATKKCGRWFQDILLGMEYTEQKWPRVFK